MTNNEHDKSDLHPEAPWWASLGPVGAVLLIVVGIGWGLWMFLGSGDTDVPVVGIQMGKVIAIGLVILGVTVMERFRSRRSRATEAEGRQDS